MLSEEEFSCLDLDQNLKLYRFLRLLDKVLSRICSPTPSSPKEYRKAAENPFTIDNFTAIY
jgi:hypothetical protein